ncbi:MAG TPA: ABC transporter ATP-binding protein [Trueperaceae bacterium]|jgi:branched-chain amino acid transport system ATP-binding protein
MPEPILRAERLGRSFGGLAAVQDLSFEVEEGEIFAIIGPNGAGKTTTLDLLSGLLEPSAGRVFLAGVDVTRLPTYRRCQMGLGRAFQVVQPFPEMTVEENLMVGALFGEPGVPAAEAERRVESALERTGLSRLRDTPAEDLNLLQEKRLEIARALATNPKVLLLDEVMAGLRPAEARQAVELVRGVRDSGVTVVFIEHVMPVVRDLADRVLVMDHGRELARGTYAEVTADERVIRAYLGEPEPEEA